jgi:uncharacterized protein (DUF1919 family)
MNKGNILWIVLKKGGSMNYSLISNSCVSAFIYEAYNPEMHSFFINYDNPFTSSWFPSDEQYVKLCENYDHYTSLEPSFGNPISLDWEKNTGSKWHLMVNNYPVMFLGDIEIHWIHEVNIPLLLKKFKGRIDISKDNENLFLWSDFEMFNTHTDKEREDLLNRFNGINGKTIFLTKNENEEYKSDTSIIKYVPQWNGKSQYDRGKDFINQWEDQSGGINSPIVIRYKEEIDRYG